jgi:curved DNA-binding protein CbpA
MSVITPFEEARAALGLGDEEDDAAAIKRSYRRAVVEHPPDTDPDGFRRVRDAYELLRDPWARAEELLTRPLPEVPPPASPAAPPGAPRGATAVALLRLAAMNADPEAWTAARPARARRPAKAPGQPNGAT